MATRCVACDEELLSISWNKQMGDWEDMCSKCRTLGKQGFIYNRDHRHVLEDAKDGDMTHPWDSSQL